MNGRDFLSTDPVRYAAAAVSDVVSKRASNEDAFGLSAEDGIYLVCDGMGGAAAGEIASSMAVDEVLRRLSQPAVAGPEATPVPLENRIVEVVREANQTIFSRAQSDPQLNGMGTTLVGVATQGRRVLVFNVGDSRCYRMRKTILEASSEAKTEESAPQQTIPEQSGPQQTITEPPLSAPRKLLQISLDHSLVEEQVRMGHMTHEEAQHSNYRNVITRALGTQPVVEPDVFELEAAPGDIFLLCSDGLSGEITDTQMESMLEADLPLNELCARLVDAANHAGGHDNITCLLVRAEG
jgi:protein phosphatase